jgi:hypothetical protein
MRERAAIAACFAVLTRRKPGRHAPLCARLGARFQAVPGGFPGARGFPIFLHFDTSIDSIVASRSRGKS